MTKCMRWWEKFKVSNLECSLKAGWYLTELLVPLKKEYACLLNSVIVIISHLEEFIFKIRVLGKKLIGYIQFNSFRLTH